jgi:ketosteroid isomerase-like protein
MSGEFTTPNLVELTGGLIDATNRGDVDAVVSFYGPHAIWESPPLGTSFKGVAAIRSFFEDWIGTYEDFEMRSEQVLDLGADVGFAVIRQNGRPAGGTGRVQTRMAVTSQWADGKIVRATVDYDIDEARAAAERFAKERG